MSNINKFAEEDFVIIRKGVASLGIGEKPISFDTDIKGQIYSINSKTEVARVDIKECARYLPYDLNDLERV